MYVYSMSEAILIIHCIYRWKRSFSRMKPALYYKDVSLQSAVEICLNLQSLCHKEGVAVSIKNIYEVYFY